MVRQEDVHRGIMLQGPIYLFYNTLSCYGVSFAMSRFSGFGMTRQTVFI